ncbi:MAG: EamA family transporter [Acetobacteraceae bacterium]|nr:EamA family transporter [Acetobacteraceae bacterium]
MVFSSCRDEPQRRATFQAWARRGRKPLAVRSAVRAKNAMSSPPDASLRGIVLILIATTIFSIADTIAKLLTTDLSAVQINWMRYLIFAAMALTISVRSPGYAFRALHPRTQIVRGLCVTVSSLLFVLCITSMPLSEAASIGFVAPLVVTVLSIPLLGEAVGVRRWAAVLAGFWAC